MTLTNSSMPQSELRQCVHPDHHMPQNVIADSKSQNVVADSKSVMGHLDWTLWKNMSNNNCTPETQMMSHTFFHVVNTRKAVRHVKMCVPPEQVWDGASGWGSLDEHQVFQLHTTDPYAVPHFFACCT